MDPRKLLYFVSIVEQGSLKKAAGQLKVSQPALSTSMDRLEASLGIKLLERSAKGVAPTPIGELIFSHARLIKDEIEFARSWIEKKDLKRKGMLTIGVLPSLGNSVVPLGLARWRADHATTHIRVIEKVQVDLLIGLLRGEFDFIIGMTEYYDMLDGLTQRVIFRDRQCVFARAGHPALRTRAITWSELVQYPWIRPMVGRVRTVLEALLQNEGVPMPKQMTEGGSVQFVKTLVSNSDHLALLPTHTIKDELEAGRFHTFAIASPLLNRSIAVFHRLGFKLDKSSRDLVAHIEAVGTDLSREPQPATKSRSRSLPQPASLHGTIGNV